MSEYGKSSFFSTIDSSLDKQIKLEYHITLVISNLIINHFKRSFIFVRVILQRSVSFIKYENMKTIALQINKIHIILNRLTNIKFFKYTLLY